MDGLHARLQSFKKSKRVKNPKKSSTYLKWPHPQDFIANPESLAEAGFYYDPSYDDPDNVTCFNCEKQLAGWEEDDDPYLIHWNKCAQSCCWAVVQCGLRADMDPSGRFVFPDKTRLPNHKTMEKARLETFTLGKGWVHDQTRNHGANSKSMARAGFAYTPHETGDDLASCLYCDVSLSGWDDDDDPMEEHRKRATKSNTICPFFEHFESRQMKPPSTKPPSKPTSKPPSRTTSRTKYQDVARTLDGEVEEDESDIPSSTTHVLGAKTPGKSRSKSHTSTKTPGAKSRNVKNIAEAVEYDEQDAPTITQKPTRSRAKSRAPLEVEKDPEEEPIRKPSRSKSKAPIEVEKDEPEEPIRKPSRSKSKAPIEIEKDEQDEPIRKPSRSKSKAPIEVEKDEPEEPEEPIRKSSRSKSKVVADTKDDAPLRKTSRKVSKPKVVQEESDKAESMAHSVLGAKRTKTAAHKRTGSRARAKSPEADSNVEETVTEATTTKSTDAQSKSQPQPRPKFPDMEDLFNEDIVLVEEYVPPPSLPPPSTTNEPAPVFTPQRTKDKPKQVSKVVEISSDEEEVEKKEPPSLSQTTTRRLEAVETMETTTLSNPTSVNGIQDSERHDVETPQPIEDTMDISMREPAGTQESVTDAEQERHTAPFTPPKPIILHEEAAGRLGAPQSHLQIPDDRPAEAQPSTPSPNTAPPLTTEPVYLPALSRLPFMPLQTLSDAELDMTVEEWIRYQIEVEQDRFKRDGERELEGFKKRAEEVRKAIEGL